MRGASHTTAKSGQPREADEALPCDDQLVLGATANGDAVSRLDFGV